MKFEGNCPPLEISGPFNEKARRNILSESVMYDDYGARMLKEPVMRVVFNDSDDYIRITRRNGLYFIRGRLIEATKPTELHHFEVGMTNAPYGDKVTGTQKALLWAARVGGGVRTVQELSTSTLNTGLGKVTSDMKKQISHS